MFDFALPAGPAYISRRAFDADGQATVAGGCSANNRSTPNLAEPGSFRPRSDPVTIPSTWCPTRRGDPRFPSCTNFAEALRIHEPSISGKVPGGVLECVVAGLCAGRSRTWTGTIWDSGDPSFFRATRGEISFLLDPGKTRVARGPPRLPRCWHHRLGHRQLLRSCVRASYRPTARCPAALCYVPRRNRPWWRTEVVQPVRAGGSGGRHDGLELASALEPLDHGAGGAMAYRIHVELGSVHARPVRRSRPERSLLPSLLHSSYPGSPGYVVLIGGHCEDSIQCGVRPDGSL